MTSHDATDAPGAPATDEVEDGPGYADAVAELESILAELEADDVDVDVLAERVARASELVRVCRRRIDAARFQVDRIVAELAQPLEGTSPEAAGTGTGEAVPAGDGATEPSLFADGAGDEVSDTTDRDGFDDPDRVADVPDVTDAARADDVVPAYDEPDVDGIDA